MTENRAATLPAPTNTPSQGACTCQCHPSDLLTPAGLVAELNGAVAESTLRNWRSLRKGPRYLLVGHSVLYPRRAVDDWLAAEAAAADRRWNDLD